MMVRMASLMVLPAMLCVGHAAPAFSAPACSLTSQTLTFGSVNPLYNGKLYTSGVATITCAGLAANASVSACLSIGKGNASGSTQTDRVISGKGQLGSIRIAITSSPSATQEIGTGSPYPPEGPINFAANGSGSGTANFPITLAITAPIVGVSPGTFNSAFNGADFRAQWASPAVASCAQQNSNAVGGGMVVNASVVAACSVIASAMNFGSVSVLNVARGATSTVTLTCAQPVTATIALDYGQSGTGPTQRHMQSGGRSITYGVYQDSAWLRPWGQTIGTDTLSVPMSGTVANVSAYGLIPVQTTPAPGTYVDVINVIVFY
jgi:spore coat protein U-like protein